MLESNLTTPGVYINEINAFPNAVVPVASAVPAFIGYTPQASYQGKSYVGAPQKVSTFAEFQAIYCLPNPPAPASPTKQYSPQYYLVPQKTLPPPTQDYITINNTIYAILPDPNTIYYLYNSVQLFYQNGGGDAYIVSVGGYGSPSNAPAAVGAQIVNPNVVLTDLTTGLALLQNEDEPTMYICPEATLLSVANNGALMSAMLSQSSSMMTSISIFDIIGGSSPDPLMFMNDITTFRNNTGSNGLNYGTAYYPFIGTTIMQSQNLDYTNLFGGNVKTLLSILSPADNPDPITATIIGNILNPPGAPLTTSQYNNALLIASATYGQIINHVLADANTLPPSGAMAGVMATIDNSAGVWQSPANVSCGASSLPIRLNDSQQSGLNVDAVSGKSVNAIRFFNGNGILVWGARTLDGNSLDWQYLSVRRTVNYLEQSCKLAARAYVFQPNDKNTWEAVKAMVGTFLMSIWAEGGLMGASPSDAYSVDCGLGSTMTPMDILKGIMNISVKVCVVRPAEYIVFTFSQEMPVSS